MAARSAIAALQTYNYFFKIAMLNPDLRESLQRLDSSVVECAKSFVADRTNSEGQDLEGDDDIIEELFNEASPIAKSDKYRTKRSDMSPPLVDETPVGEQAASSPTTAPSVADLAGEPVPAAPLDQDQVT